MNTWPTANEGIARMIDALTGRELRVYQVVRGWKPDQTPPPRSENPSALHIHNVLRKELNIAEILETLEWLEDKHLVMPGDAFITASHQFSTYTAKVYDPNASDAVLMQQHKPAPKAQQELFT